MVKLKKLIIFFCCMLFTCVDLFAAHPLTTDDIGTVDIGKYELEVFYDNCKSETRNHFCGISLKHGITEKIDVGISFPYQLEPKLAEPLGTLTLGFKFLLMKDIFALTVSNELGSKKYFINGIFTQEIKPISVHVNIGYATSGDENTEGKITYSSAFECPFEKIDLVGEVIGDKVSLQNWLLGVRYKIKESVFVDCAYGNSFRNTDEKISFGFHAEF